ncbi:hypothetical protein BJX63DRAFT_376317 [Aspergillus granulosus]|uniref:Uncharacterized protein n=1 Tax=Aspergillus granulosus TaxID=176169 RepID=A0ABR4I892_9EURO
MYFFPARTPVPRMADRHVAGKASPTSIVFSIVGSVVICQTKTVHDDQRAKAVVDLAFRVRKPFEFGKFFCILKTRFCKLELPQV